MATGVERSRAQLARSCARHPPRAVTISDDAKVEITVTDAAVATSVAGFEKSVGFASFRAEKSRD